MSDNNNVSTKKQDINDDNQQEKSVPELRFPEFNDDWKKYKLKDLAKIQRGASPRPISSHEWYDNKNKKVGWVRIGDVTNSTKYLYKTEDYFSEEGVKKSRFLPKGSLIMSICATIGKPIITGIDTCIHDGFVGFSNLDNVNKEFLYYILKNLEGKFISLSQTGSQANLNTNLINNTKINIPSIDEQKRIVDILTIVDRKIELLEKKLVLWDKYIFSLKCNYFDNINVEKIVKFKEIIKKGKAGGTPKSSIQSYYNGEIPFLTINDMTKQGKFIKSTEKTITKEGLNNSSAWIVPKNSLLYSMYASIGFVSINKIDLTTSQAIYSIILKDNVNQEYIFHYLKNYKRFIHKYIETGTQGNLNSKIIKNIKIKLPSLEEQNYYSNLFNIFDYKIQTLNTKIKQYKTFKKYLLQNMFI